MKKPTPNFSQLLMILFWCLLALGQLQRFQLTPTVAVYVHDLVVLLVLGISGFNQGIRENVISQLKNLIQKKSSKAFVILVLVTATLASLTTGVTAHWLYLARATAYVLFTWVMARKTSKEFFLRGYLIAGLTAAALGFIQYLFLPDTRFLYYLGWDDHYYRLIGTQLDPAFAGALLILTFWLVQGLLSKLKLPQVMLSLLLILAIALTFSRATYLGFSLSIVVYFLLLKSRKGAPNLLCIPVLLLMIQLAPKPTGEGVNLLRTSTVTSRVVATETAISSLTPWQWLVGRGLFVPVDQGQTNEVVSSDHANQPDSLIILLISGLGVVGTVLLLYLTWQERQRILTLEPWALASLSAILAHAQFNNTLFQPFVWLVVVAIVIRGGK